MNISKFVMPEIIFGKDSLQQAGECCLRLGAKKVLVVSDPGVMEAGWVDKVTDICRTSHLPYEIFYEITANPKDYEITRGVDIYQACECDAIIGVGGGSAIDAAKAIAILATNGGTIHDYEGVDKIEVPLPPLLMIPTTAGSGSEVSQFSVIVDSKRHVKMTIISKSLIPDIAITDPYTLVTKNRDLTAETGMDVLTHAIEAFVSAAATPLTDVQAKNAMILVAKYLRPSVASRTNEEAKTAMAMASLQAGLAFSNAILGAVHAMSHAVGGYLDMPHGKLNAILLPYVMEYNFLAAPERFLQIAELLGQNIGGMASCEAGKLAIHHVKQLAADIGIPPRLSDIGLREEHIEQMSDAASKDVCIITNPRDIAIKDLEEIFYRAL
ncbi:iron-containing alcohol dehydrogenase [Aneurinibacillus sp. Ricciae_BoGa-3]|uniref:iron-containing alcohol dehydrogenase n=1 Tax=Aneurinibacillus sp. Ricciae_BoGa-3 TaxID=3022697 RepID=UPI0023411BC4|nr:iron-containing alcohol dehydrogenase [Aneurinibacillus sp. Ricciae_BoGa-3]WCK52561.1 iron-containing alcohol dehydrogenase [Aneurinibacillus sp. Ricciae_BoGa-3]